MGSYLLHREPFGCSCCEQQDAFFGQLNFYGEPVPPPGCCCSGWVGAASAPSTPLCLPSSSAFIEASYQKVCLIDITALCSPNPLATAKLEWFIANTLYIVLYVSALGPRGSFSLRILPPGKSPFVPKTPDLRATPGRPPLPPSTELLTILCDSKPDLSLLVDSPVSPASMYLLI